LGEQEATRVAAGTCRSCGIGRREERRKKVVVLGWLISPITLGKSDRSDKSDCCRWIVWE
jgi:hypothetical protein